MSNMTNISVVESTPAVSTQVMQSMFNHLAASYPEDEARDILTQKYPGSAQILASINADSYRVTRVEMGTKIKVTDPIGAPDLATAVKAKVAKTPKVASESKVESKADRARAMYDAAPIKDRKVMIEIFMTELNMSKSGASTYFYNVKG